MRQHNHASGIVLPCANAYYLWTATNRPILSLCVLVIIDSIIAACCTGTAVCSVLSVMYRLALLMNVELFMSATYHMASMSRRCPSIFHSLGKSLGWNCREASG